MECPGWGPKTHLGYEMKKTEQCTRYESSHSACDEKTHRVTFVAIIVITISVKQLPKVVIGPNVDTQLLDIIQPFHTLLLKSFLLN